MIARQCDLYLSGFTRRKMGAGRISTRELLIQKYASYINNILEHVRKCIFRYLVDCNLIPLVLRVLTHINDKNIKSKFNRTANNLIKAD